MDKTKLIIGISGASGIIYAIRLLEFLQQLEEVETHLIISKAAEQARHHETELSSKDIYALADYSYNFNDIAAVLASGSFQTDGMIIIPCSMNTLAEIAHGIANNLLSRAADVTLKEKRQLVLMPRETPLHAGHLKNMLTVVEYGGIIAPPMPAFYTKPKSLNDLVNHSVGRILDLFGIDSDSLVKRWE